MKTLRIYRSASTVCLLLSLFVLAGTSCAYKLRPNQVVSVQGKMIPIEGSLPLHKEDIAFLEPYKQQLEREMSEQVGCSADRLVVILPQDENKLSNFAVDMVYQIIAELSPIQPDLAMLNIGGLRAPIAKGPIRIRDIYSVFPFDNRLALVSVKGKYLRKCLPAYVRRANGISGGRIEIRIEKDKAEYLLFIDGKPVEDERIYRVATIDYLADGNDGFIGLSSAEERIDYDLTLRDAAMQYVRRKFAKGECIDGVVDGRLNVRTSNTSSPKTP